MKPEWDLFITYNRADRDAVAALHRALHAHHIAGFLDQVNMTPGHPWMDEVTEVLASVRGVLVCVGGGGLGAIQKREVQLSLLRQAQEERSGRTFPVIPALLAGADSDAVSGMLAEHVGRPA